MNCNTTHYRANSSSVPGDPTCAVWLLACSSAATRESTSETDSSTAGPDAEGAGDAGSTDSGHAEVGPGSNDGGDSSVSTEGAEGGENDGAAGDGPSNGCEVFGAPGLCIDVSACAAEGNHTSYAGHCPGAANIECCIVTPNTADNPPVPVGWVLMQQSQVTTAMTNWAVMILDDPTTYPMFDTVMMTFGSLLVMARVEWHPPDFQNSVVHRGVTLYVQSD